MRFADVSERFWFRAAPPAGLIAARILLALNALWIVLSRVTLPTLVDWPDPFWRNASVFLRIRFLMPPLPAAIEIALYATLIVALVCVVIGVKTRAAAFVAALLLYHFAPFEDIFSSQGGPFFRGLTLPVSGLFLVAFARAPRASDAPSSEWRWPLVLIQLLFAFTYFFSGISKMRTVGPLWSTARNFEGLVLGLVSPEYVAPWARFVVGNEVLCRIGAVGGTVMDFAVILAVFSRRAARVIVPLTLLAHLVIVKLFGVVFLAAPLLLLFVNWEWVGQRVRAVRRAPIAAGSPAPHVR